MRELAWLGSSHTLFMLTALGVTKLLFAGPELQSCMHATESKSLWEWEIATEHVRVYGPADGAVAAICLAHCTTEVWDAASSVGG